MTPGQLRDFAHRDWAALAASKREYWVEQFQAHGFRPAWEASNALLAEMRAIRPNYPAPSERADDRAHHERVAALLDRAAHAFTNPPPAR